MRRILSIEGLNWSWIKAAVLAIGVCNRRDWRLASPDAIACDPREFRQNLAVCLPRGPLAAGKDIDAWIEHTAAIFRDRLTFLFDLSANERKFLDDVLDRGEVDADLLDVEPEIRARIRAMPMLAWKSGHVRRYHRLDQQEIDWKMNPCPYRRGDWGRPTIPRSSQASSI